MSTALKFTRISIADEKAWTSAIQEFEPCASHSWAFNDAFADPNIELVVGRSDDLNVVCPVTHRLQAWGIELLSPLGYAGPLYSGTIRSIRQEWFDFWKSEGAVTGYLQLHPLLQQDQMLLFENEDAWVANHNFTIDLTQTEAQFRSNLARDHRARLNKWFRGTVAISQSPREKKVEAFVALYQDFAKRRGLSSLYTFDADVLYQMCQNPSVEIIAAETAEGEIEAVSLFPYGTHGAYYYLNGASEAGQNHARAILWTAMLHFKARGLQYLNLAGGIQTHDSLHNFKRRFGTTEHPTHALKQIYNSEVYERLCAHYQVDTSRTGYFPPWRSRI